MKTKIITIVTILNRKIFILIVWNFTDELNWWNEVLFMIKNIKILDKYEFLM